MSKIIFVNVKNLVQKRPVPYIEYKMEIGWSLFNLHISKI